ncbi:MAG: membrane protein insertion efficiency factor YidD [Candidatus Omnitrophota bacterium]|nr:membrane protein insertion efficiency factor YidD [Candidatus Omnitrophota bacterium]MBU1895149.1 membrane protein insertion efficiency factor YidD [Candidatus Omnitrophota bacterium]
MVKNLLLAAIKAYKKVISPYMKRSCRYFPTCSEYAYEAINRFGSTKGLILSIWRIMRCNPFSRGGYDPVIENKKNERDCLWKKD